MLRLAVPVVLGELGWMAMGVVDTMMVGRIDAASIGAVSVGRALFIVAAIIGIGMLLGLDTVISSAFGAGQPGECRRYLLHGVYLSLFMTLPLMALLHGLAGLLETVGVDPAVRELTLPYARVISLSVLPIFLYATFRRYLQAINLVRPVMLALLSANLVNVLFNWLLIFGNLGFPALGATGAAWASCLASCYMAAFLGLAIVLHDRREGSPLRAVSLRPYPIISTII